MFADTYRLTLLGQAKIWVAKTFDNHLIGQLFVSLKGGRPELADGRTRAYVFGFRIRPEYRNLGIGTMMMRTVEEDLRENYFRVITLNVTQVNHAARKFYERLGYRVVGDDPGDWSYLDQYGHKQQMHEPAWRMEKELL
jgi:ribosomal protein S18 acetylase RimI-like enzyme